MNPAGFNIKEIESTLTHFQSKFDLINKSLSMEREDFTDEIRNNLLEGYDFLNSLYSKDIDIFSPSGLYNFVELNHIVLCGIDPKKREEFYHHIEKTRDIFRERITPIIKWYKSNSKKTDFYIVAGGLYAQLLSFPQLYIEGNHRTGNLIFNYYLLVHELPPFIITEETAKSYFDISENIKFSKKGNFTDDIKRNKLAKGIGKLLSESIDQRFIYLK